MSLMSLISLLSALAPAPTSAPWACELAPSYGQGHAVEGRIDDMSTLALSCGYRALRFQNLSLWPMLGASTQNWTIYRDRNAVKEVNSYSVQDLSIGGRASYTLLSDWDLSYEVQLGRGKGNLRKILSTSQSAENQSFDRLTHSSLTQGLAVERRLSQRLAISFGLQRISAGQNWNAGDGNFSSEQIDSQQHLSLTGGLAGQRDIRDSSRQETTQIKIGLRMFFGNLLGREWRRQHGP